MLKYAFKQKHIFGCGLACIRSIALYYNKTKLIKVAKIKYPGLSFKNMIDLMSKADLKMNGYLVYDSYINDIKSPFIAHLSLGFIKHYVVVYKSYKNLLLIMDPSIGKMIFIKKKHFKYLWSKKILLIEN